MSGMSENHDKIDQNNNEGDESTLVVDIRDLYAFKAEDLEVELSDTFYSNLTYMQVAPRDVIIDFLEMPGIKKGGKVVIGGIRVYLSHTAALKMAESLHELLAKNEHRIELFKPSHLDEVELTTKVQSSSEKEQA